jgi:hypothetical protein
MRQGLNSLEYFTTGNLYAIRAHLPSLNYVCEVRPYYRPHYNRWRHRSHPKFEAYGSAVLSVLGKRSSHEEGGPHWVCHHLASELPVNTVGIADQL